MPLMAATTETQQESSSLFVLPRTLDEILVTVVAIAWPLMFIFLLRRDMDLNAAGEALAWVLAFGIQVGILFGLRTARRRGGQVG